MILELKIVPLAGNVATRGHGTHWREGTTGNTLLCKHWSAINSLEGKIDFSKDLALSQGVAWWPTGARILLFLVG